MVFEKTAGIKQYSSSFHLFSNSWDKGSILKKKNIFGANLLTLFCKLDHFINVIELSIVQLSSLQKSKFIYSNKVLCD